jgi:hypothetical protein
LKLFLYFFQVKWEKTGEVKTHQGVELMGLGACCQKCYLSARGKAASADKLFHCWHKDNEKSFDVICRRVARLPELVPTLLELGNDHLLSVPLVRSILASTEAVGPWLLKQLDSHVHVALKFLEIVSKPDVDAKQIEVLAVPWAHVSMPLRPPAHQHAVISHVEGGDSKEKKILRSQRSMDSVMAPSTRQSRKSSSFCTDGVDPEDVFSLKNDDLDWIQIGDLGFDAGTSFRDEHPETGIPWLKKGPDAIIWMPLSSDLGASSVEAAVSRWQYWEPLSLLQQHWNTLSSHDRMRLWRKKQAKEKGRLLTLSEAKEVLRNGALQPGTSAWAPVMLDKCMQKEALELLVSKLRSSMVSVGSGSVEMSPLRAAAEPSGFPRAASVLGTGTSNGDYVSAGPYTEWFWPHFTLMKDENLPPWRSVVANNGVLLSLSEAQDVLRHAPLLRGEEAWAPVLLMAEDAVAASQPVGSVTGSRSEKSISSSCSLVRCSLCCCSSNLREASAEKPFPEEEASSTSPLRKNETSQIGTSDGAIDRYAVTSSTHSERALAIMLDATLVDIQMLDFVQVGDLNYATGTSWRTQFEKEPTEDSWLCLKPDVALFKPVAKTHGNASGRFIEEILNVKDQEMRKKLLNTRLVEAILLRSETVGSWVVDRLKNPKTQVGVVEYLGKVSNIAEKDRDRAPKDSKAISLTEAFSELRNFVPSLLQLSESEQELAVSISLVQRVLDSKLADRPVALMVVLLDIVSVFAALVSFVVVVTANQAYGAIVVLFLLNVYFAWREKDQIYNMYEHGLMSQYYCDAWNIVDIIGFTCSFAVAGMALSPAIRGESTFRCVAALGSFAVWLKLLATVKVLSIKLATFVYSLNRIVVDLWQFIFVMTAVTCMFATTFHVLLHEVGEELDDAVESGGFLNDPRPFQTFSQGLLSLFNMIMGNYDSDWFETDTKWLSVVSVILFVLFMFFVVIVMLNVLIAVVSDSYAGAKMKARILFYKSRLELVAELDALGYTKKEQTWVLPVWVNAFIQKVYSDFGYRLCDGSAVAMTEEPANAKFDQIVNHILEQKEEVVSMGARLEKIESMLEKMNKVVALMGPSTPKDAASSDASP